MKAPDKVVAEALDRLYPAEGLDPHEVLTAINSGLALDQIRKARAVLDALRAGGWILARRADPMTSALAPAPSRVEGG